MKIEAELCTYSAAGKQLLSDSFTSFIIGKVHVASGGLVGIDTLYFCFIPSSNSNNSTDFSLPNILHLLLFGLGTILKTDNSSFDFKNVTMLQIMVIEYVQGCNCKSFDLYVACIFCFFVY